jgi:hypothetical protein
VAGADGNDAIDPIAAEAVMTVSRVHPYMKGTIVVEAASG